MAKAKPTDAEVEKMDAEVEKMLQQFVEQYPVEQYPGFYGIDPNEWADAPCWSNEEAQVEYVRDRILGYCFLVYPYRSKEERAVEATKRGKHKKMVELLRQPDQQLTQSTRDLLTEFFDGTRNLKTGRAKGETKNDAGRAKKAEKLRRGAVHQAAEIFLVLRDSLPLIYPEQSQTDIRDRALLLAAMMKGVDTETIDNYRKKSKDKRAPWRVYWYQEEDCGRHWFSPEPDLL